MRDAGDLEFDPAAAHVCILYENSMTLCRATANDSSGILNNRGPSHFVLRFVGPA